MQTPALAAGARKHYAPTVDLPLAEAAANGSAALSLLGETLYRTGRKHFGIPLEDRRQHVVLLGKTDMGKSTLLFRLTSSDIAGRPGRLRDRTARRPDRSPARRSLQMKCSEPEAPARPTPPLVALQAHDCNTRLQAALLKPLLCLT